MSIRLSDTTLLSSNSCAKICMMKVSRPLGDSHHGWVNDPTSSVNLQLNELIEHIASFVMSYKIKYMDESDLSELVEEYLDDTYTLFSSYGINDSDLRRWQRPRRDYSECSQERTSVRQ